MVTAVHKYTKLLLCLSILVSTKMDDHFTHIPYHASTAWPSLMLCILVTDSAIAREETLEFCITVVPVTRLLKGSG